MLRCTQKFSLAPADRMSPTWSWRAPIGWSGLIVSASWAAGLLERCFLARVGLRLTERWILGLGISSRRPCRHADFPVRLR
jgi:hypothetical protein